MDTSVGATDAEGSQRVLSLLGGVSEDTMEGATITRIVAALSFASTTVAGAWGLSKVTFGIGVISQESFTANNPPDPATVGDYPVRGWMHRETFMLSQNGTPAP